MKILCITDRSPWPLHEGTRQRLYHLLSAIARAHAVTLVSCRAQTDGETVLDGCPLTRLCQRVIEIPFAERAEESGSLWTRRLDRIGSLMLSPQPDVVQRRHSPQLLRVLRELRETEHFDRVWVARSYMAEIVRAADFEKVIVDVDDIETISLYRRLKLTSPGKSTLLDVAELGKLYAFERGLPRRFWRLVVCKESDRGFFHGDGKVFVVPNGTPEHPPCDPENERPGSILFVGTMGYEPNVDAAKYFAQSVLPRICESVPTAHFHIVGRNCGADVRSLDDGRRCIVHGMVPDVSPYFEAASIVVAPVRAGGGTRLKILEALSRGKAVVATTIGAEGLDLLPGIHLEIADDPGHFAAACVRLLNDPGRRRRLAQAGRQRVLEQYRWESIGRAAERALAAP